MYAFVSEPSVRYNVNTAARDPLFCCVIDNLNLIGPASPA